MQSLRQVTRKQWLVTAMLAMLLVVTWWNVGYMRSQRTAAQRAAADLEYCSALSARITELRKRPSLAGDVEMGQKDLGDLIDRASQASNLPRQQIVQVDPTRDARRIENSPYLRKPIFMSFDGVDLTQLLPMLYHLTQGSGMTVTDLRLQPPPVDTTGRLWNAQVTLTYLIYVPESSKERPR